MASILDNYGGFDLKATDPRTSNPKEEIQSPIIASSSVSTSIPSGGEEKTNPTLTGLVGTEIQDLKDREDVYLPVDVERWYLASFFWIMIVCGWSDGTT